VAQVDISSDSLNELKNTETFQRLTKDQMRYVVAMQNCKSKKDAAEELGIPVGTIYNWPEYVNEAVELLARDIVEFARQLRRKALAEAVAVQIKGLESDDERVRQAAAKEIFEAELGKATQALGIDPENNEITFRVVRE
jgi:hypothetical protein